MLTQEAMLTLAAELTDAQAQGDAESLAAIAWQLSSKASEDLAEIVSLRAAVHAAGTRHQQTPSPARVAARTPSFVRRTLSRARRFATDGFFHASGFGGRLGGFAD